VKKTEGADAAAPAKTSSSAAENQRQIPGQGGGLGPPYEPPRHPPIPEARLLEIVQELVEPESWKTTNGVYARAVPGRLIIRHTLRVHEKIPYLLHRLESSADGGFGARLGLGVGGAGQDRRRAAPPSGTPATGAFLTRP
jgi:hypothetical protein